MAKKKIRDCTYKEIKEFCKSQSCESCPLSALSAHYSCCLFDCPCYTDEKALDIEIELTDNEH